MRCPRCETSTDLSTLEGVQVKVAGTDTVAIDAGDIPLPSEGNYSVIAHLDAEGNPTIGVFQNDTSSIAAGQGRIINISSGTVPQGVPGFMHYVTSKSAIIGMTRVMARELGDDNINVNAVMPGYTKTEVEHASMDEAGHAFVVGKRILKREETPDDLIGIVMFLASPASAFITGQSIACCGGEVML